MAVANSVSDWKNKTISLIVNNDEIMDCLDMTDEEKEEPVYTRIFPYNHIPYTQSESKVFITLTVDIPKITFNKVWAYPRMTVRIICHQDKMRLNKAGVSDTRIDYMAKLISKLLVGRKDYGYGNLRLATDYEDTYNFYYHYRELVFIGEDLVQNPCEDKY